MSCEIEKRKTQEINKKEMEGEGNGCIKVSVRGKEKE